MHRGNPQKTNGYIYWPKPEKPEDWHAHMGCTVYLIYPAFPPGKPTPPNDEFEICCGMASALLLLEEELIEGQEYFPNTWKEIRGAGHSCEPYLSTPMHAVICLGGSGRGWSHPEHGNWKCQREHLNLEGERLISLLDTLYGSKGILLTL